MFPNLYNAAYQNKAKTGTAVVGDVLAGKTFTSSAGVGLTGTMVNRGQLNWNPTTSETYTVQPGYYSGGRLDSTNAHNNGYNNGYESSKKTKEPTILKDFTTNTTWSYTINEDCYLQVICTAGGQGNRYLGKISINNIDMEFSIIDGNQAEGWIGSFSKVYYCKQGDIITSTVVDSLYKYSASLIQWK